MDDISKHIHSEVSCCMHIQWEVSWCILFVDDIILIDKIRAGINWTQILERNARSQMFQIK